MQNPVQKYTGKMKRLALATALCCGAHWAVLPAFAADTSGDVVKIATSHFPPYFIDPKNAHSEANRSYQPGFLQEGIEAVFALAGMKTQFQYLPLARAENFVQIGKFDCISPVRAKPTNDYTLSYSSPLPGGPVVLMGRAGTGHRITRVSQLENYHIGTVLGDQAVTALMNDTVLKNTDATRTNSLNLQKLVNRRIDYIIIDYAVALKLITDDFPQYADKVEPVYPPLAYQSIYLACNAKTSINRNLIERFNDALKHAQENGLLNTIATRYGLDDLSTEEATPETLQ
ncbi:substrate-binding periplasmic protein [Oleiphilus messinensis]|nr:transporter substrate-binding domain-containing protein [Oleiphilus messinensis]